MLEENKSVQGSKNKDFSFMSESEKNLGVDKVLIGSVLGAIFGLVAIIPWILVSLIGFFVSFLGYLIAIAIYKGFEIGAGRPSKILIPLIIILILLYIPLAQFVAEITLGLKEGLDIGLIFSFISFNIGGFVGDMLPNILMGYLFAFLGAFQVLRRTNK